MGIPHCGGKKKDGRIRPCGDYRLLNDITKPDKYPLPRIADIMDKIASKLYFSTLDLKKAFHQIAIHPDDVQKTAITTPFGLFEYQTMPFGLRNAAQMFQRHMDSILQGFEAFAAAYIDDIIIFSDSAEDHEQHISTILGVLKENSLQLNNEKCVLRSKEIEFLGFRISNSGIEPIQKKIDEITNIKEPSDTKSLRRFIGAATFYQWMIPNFSQTMAPLHDLLTTAKVNKKIQLNNKQKHAFSAMKQQLKNITKMYPFDANKDLILCTDASETAVGASLNHEINHKLSPIAFFSRKLGQAEKKYSTFDRELLAIYLAVKKFKHYLEGSQVRIRTDHKPLLGIQSMKEPSNRQWRYIEFLNQFSFRLEYVKGTENVVADFLSRANDNATDETSIMAITETEIINEQNKEKKKLLSNNSLKIETLRGILYDLSYSNKRIILPTTLRYPEFLRLHGLAHTGANKTIDLIRDRYVWPRMKADVRKWVKECHACQSRKISRHTKSKIGSLPNRGRFKIVHMDIVGPLPPSDGKKFMITFIDRQTSWPEVVTVHDITTSSITRALTNTWISRFGPPEIIVTDQGRQFMSTQFKELCTKWGIEHRNTTAYHPECNGKIERFHRSLKNALRAHSENTEATWAHDLPIIMLALRNASITGTTTSPAKLLYGTSTNLPGDLMLDEGKNTEYTWEDVKASVQAYESQLIPRQTTRRIFVPKALKDCEQVWVRNENPPTLKPRYDGPYQVISRSDNMKTLLLDINGTQKRISIDRVKPTFSPKEETYSPGSYVKSQLYFPDCATVG